MASYDIRLAVWVRRTGVGRVWVCVASRGACSLSGQARELSAGGCVRLSTVGSRLLVLERTVAGCWVRSAARQAMVTAVIVNTIVYESGAILGPFVEGMSEQPLQVLARRR